MDFKLFGKRFKISLFSIIIFVFFLMVSVISLQVVRSKILENSHIMGQEVAARFAITETSKLKTQEMLLRSGAQNVGQLLYLKQDWTDAEMDHLLQRYAEYMESTSELDRFDMSAVINGRLVGNRLTSDAGDPTKLRWYQAAMNNKGAVAYTNLYEYGSGKAHVLTMAVRIGRSDNVLAMNLYPQQLNSLLADNKLPMHSFYYLCDPNGNIMFAINDRDLTIEAQQPYVDRIFSEIRKGMRDDGSAYIVDYEGNKRGVYYAISEKGWISIVTIPYDFLLGEYQNLLQWFILTLVLLLLLMLLLSLREYLLHKQVERGNEVVRMLGNAYMAIFRINVAKGQYAVVKVDSKLGFETKEEGSYAELLDKLVESVEADAAEEFAQTFAAGNIQKLVERKLHDFGGDFRRRFGKEYKWVSVRLLYDDKLSSGEVIMTFKEVDAEKLKELEHLQLTERALRVARQNVKSRNMFFSAMSHDMRAPLNGIIGMAELAGMNNSKPKLVEEYVQKIKSSGKQLLTLINDILEMARIDNGQVEHLQEQFAMDTTIKEISGMFEAQADLEQKNYKLELELGNELVIGDLQSLQQIMNNVLSNALKYTPAKGNITFSARRDNCTTRDKVWFTFKVQDTGYGMSEKFLEKIYRPFERDGRFGVPKVTGTGLGMTIVKSLVERLEGTIEITSKVDEGTCVTIRLPFTSVGQAPERKEAKMPKLADFAGSKVLVVDDNDINMEIISELLKMNGLNVLQAADGMQAVAVFKAEPENSISLVLMDMQMPELDGCGATRQIRALNRKDAATVPIFALTGNSGSDDVEAAMQAGMNDYMVKPVQMKQLARLMGEYLHPMQ